MLLILIFMICSPSCFFRNNFCTLLFAVIIVVAIIESFFLFNDSNLLVAMKDVCASCCSIMRSFSSPIFYFIASASLYLPSLTSRFFFYSSSRSLVEVRTEYLLAVFMKRFYSWSIDLFLMSMVCPIFFFTWLP